MDGDGEVEEKMDELMDWEEGMDKRREMWMMLEEDGEMTEEIIWWWRDEWNDIREMNGKEKFEG